MRKMILAVVAAASLTAFIPVTAGPAQAEPVPSGCSSGWYYQNYKIWASCKGGSGYVRAVATCKTSSGSSKVYGPWVVVQSGIDGQSVATCSDHSRKALGHDYQIKKY